MDKYTESVNATEKELIDQVTKQIKAACDAMREKRPQESLVGTYTIVFGVEKGVLMGQSCCMRITDMEDANPIALSVLAQALLDPRQQFRTVKTNGEVVLHEETPDSPLQ